MVLVLFAENLDMGNELKLGTVVSVGPLRLSLSSSDLNY